MKGAAATLAAGIAIATATACSTGRPSPRSAAPVAVSVEPHWQDVFDRVPQLLVVVRPRALRQDKVYGPLLRQVIDLARQHSRVVSATRELDVVEDADEVIVGVDGVGRDRTAGDEGTAPIVMVVRGVRGDVDPAAMVDADGHALWAPGPGGPVRELVQVADGGGSADDSLTSSLFELPGRTWVIAAGSARARAREAFLRHRSRPPMDLGPGALAVVRIDGPSLVARVRALRSQSELGTIGRSLQSVTLELPAGADRNVHAALLYDDAQVAGAAEATVRDVIGAVARKKPERLVWLAEATVARTGARLEVQAPLPVDFVVKLMPSQQAAAPAQPTGIASDRQPAR